MANTQTRFSVNNVNYIAKPFDFDMVCELEDMGVSFEKIDKLPLGLIRAYFAICANLTKEQAAQQIQAHLINGGKLDDITEPMAKEMNDSDFFRSMSENKDQGNSKTQGKTGTGTRKTKEVTEE